MEGKGKGIEEKGKRKEKKRKGKGELNRLLEYSVCFGLSKENKWIYPEVSKAYLNFRMKHVQNSIMKRVFLCYQHFPLKHQMLPTIT